MWIQCCVCLWMVRHLCVPFCTQTHTQLPCERYLSEADRSTLISIPPPTRPLHSFPSYLYIIRTAFFSTNILQTDTDTGDMAECLVTSVLPYQHSKHLVRHPALQTFSRLLEQDNTSAKHSAESTQCHCISPSLSLSLPVIKFKAQAPGQDLWLTKWHCRRVSCQNFIFPLSVSLVQNSNITASDAV